jgi:Rod binding domain-containing protein
MTTSPLQSGVRAEAIPLTALADNPNIRDSEKLEEASRQFEAVLLRQILQQARKPVFPSSLTSDSATHGIYQDMVNTQLADSISRSGTFGLGDSLQTQLAPADHEKNMKQPNPTNASPAAGSLTSLDHD